MRSRNSVNEIRALKRNTNVINDYALFVLIFYALQDVDKTLLTKFVQQNK